jgi:hypothetical protein
MEQRNACLNGETDTKGLAALKPLLGFFAPFANPSRQLRLKAFSAISTLR